MSSSSSLSSTQSENDYGRYKRVKLAPHAAEMPTPLQPEEHINITPNLSEIPINITPQLPENVLQGTKGPGSDSEAEVWSFDRAINEVFRLLLSELRPKTTQEKTPVKPLSGIEHLLESHTTPLLVLPQSKLVENTIKFIQDKLNTDKCCKDWICHLVTSLAPTKFYKRQNQYFPTDNVPTLEPDASLLDLSNKGRSAVPIKNLEAWEKKACKLIVINSHADLFPSAAYLCFQQESMSVAALSRLLEAVAKSIKHVTACPQY